jgi:threonine dehydrogenase-like Zn-dependent dehydrogenase
MRILGAIGLAAILMATTAGAGVAAIGSDQAREANANNATGTTTKTGPTANQPGQAGQADTGSGKSVGPQPGAMPPIPRWAMPKGRAKAARSASNGSRVTTGGGRLAG